MRTVLVSHGNLITMLLKHYDARFGCETWLAFTNPDVFHVKHMAEGVQVERLWQ